MHRVPRDISGRQLAQLLRKYGYNITRQDGSHTNNIAEGDGRYHYQENIQFCRLSRGSLSELIDDLNVCLDQGYFPDDYLSSLKQKAYDLNKRLNGCIATFAAEKTAILSNPVTQSANKLLSYV